MIRHHIPGVSGWDLIAPLLAEMPAEMAEELENGESPIENMFATALSLVLLTVPEPIRPRLRMQVPIDRYRADIVVAGPFGGPRVVFECDGAEFHKDKAKDAKRAAVIQKHGYRVVRISGSEINHNPLGYARVMLREVGLVRG